MARLARKDWAGFVTFLHPSTLQEFKFYVMKITQVRIQTGANDPRFDAIFGRPTLDEVKAASADVLLANFLRAATEAAPDFERVLMQTKIQRLGVVDEGAEFKHVVVRSTYQVGDSSGKKVEVITLQKDGTSWKLLMPSSIEMFLNQLGWPKIDR